jgi:hypothetical protein
MNNFDNSTTGVKLELSCFYDNDLASIWFKDEIFNEGNEYHYNDVVDLADHNNYKITVKELREKIKADYDYSLSSQYMGKAYSKLTKIELVEFLENVAYGKAEIKEFYQDNFTPLYNIIETRGYSQGDYATVYIPKEIDHKVDSDYIDNLFWDAPVYCRLMIDDNEYYLEEYLLSPYDYDTNLILSGIEKDLNHNKKEYILAWIKDNLPEQPDYR